MPTEGTWRAQARAVDTAGQSDLDTADRTWIVTEDGEPPTVSISTARRDGAADGSAAAHRRPGQAAHLLADRRPTTTT